MISIRLAAAAALVLCCLSATATAQTCAHAASVATLGGGTPGTIGVPILGYGGSPVVGRPFALRVSNVLPGAPVVLAAGTGGAPIPLPLYGAVQHALPPYFALDLRAAGADGVARGFLVQPSLSPSTCGVTFTTQALVGDAGAQGFLAFSAALAIEVGAVRGLHERQFDDARIDVGHNILTHTVVDLDGDGADDVVTVGG